MALDAAYLGDAKTLFPVGLRSGHGKFLTVEKFGDQLNSNGTALRTTQIWQFVSNGQGKYSFKGPKGKYLSADLEVTVTAEEIGDKELFSVEWKDGVVLIKNKDGKNLCADKEGKVSVAGAGADQEWELVINYHPQICLLTQKKYLHVDGKSGEVRNSKTTQFGTDTMLTMEPMDTDPMKNRGQWALKGSNGKFIKIDPTNGNCSAVSDDKNADTAVSFEFHANQMAIRAIATGKYLASGGQTIKAIRSQLGAKEIFQLVDSDAQIALKAFNGKWVSFQGANLISNKTEVTDDEIFMLEWVNNKWALRTVGEVYVSAKDGGAVSVDSAKAGDEELFELEFQEGKAVLKTKAGKYLKAATLGGVDAKGSDPTAKECQFEVLFSNRPQIVFLTSVASFVGIANGKVWSNKSLPEQFHFEFKDGLYAVKTQDGQYFKVVDNKVELAADAEYFQMEFHNNKLQLKSGGKYVKVDTQAGSLVLGSDKPGEALEQFEF